MTDVGDDGLLARMRARRGYVLRFHEVLAEVDPAFLEAYDDFAAQTYQRPGSALDRREQECAYLGALIALGTDRQHLVAHMNAALRHGISPQALLALVESLVLPCGVPRFIHAFAALEEVLERHQAPSVARDHRART